jgi:hypothetical protein
MGHHSPVQEDPQQLAQAQEMWSNFMNITKYSVIGIAGLLLIMAGLFVTF